MRSRRSARSPIAPLRLTGAAEGCLHLFLPGVGQPAQHAVAELDKLQRQVLEGQQRAQQYHLAGQQAAPEHSSQEGPVGLQHLARFGAVAEWVSAPRTTPGSGPAERAALLPRQPSPGPGPGPGTNLQARHRPSPLLTSSRLSTDCTACSKVRQSGSSTSNVTYSRHCRKKWVAIWHSAADRASAAAEAGLRRWKVGGVAEVREDGNRHVFGGCLGGCLGGRGRVAVQ